MEYKRYILILISIIIVGIILFGILYEDNPETNPVETPDYNKSINIDNELNNSIDIRIIVRDSERLEIYNKSHYINNSEELNNIFERESSDEIKNYNITAIYDGQTESSIITTSQCFGNSYVTVREDNNLDVTYSVC